MRPLMTLLSAGLLIGCGRPAPHDPWGPSSSLATALPSALPTGADQARPPGVPPVLQVSDLIPGQSASWTISDLDPGERVYVGRSFAATGPVLCPPVMGGLCLDLHNPVQVHAVLQANGAGVATFTATVPSTVPTGLAISFQAAAVRGAGGSASVKSNLVVTTVTDAIDTAVGPSGLPSRPSNPDCLAGDRPPSGLTLDLQRVYSTATLNLPTTLIQRPGDDSRWYVGELDGRVKRFENVASPTSVTALDITSRVVSGGELGLLGMAFDPDFPTDPYLYVSYTGGTGGSPISRVSRFTTTDGGNTFQAASEAVIFSVAQPYSNHNGGNIIFGPDGYLYFGLGDGGSGGDPGGRGQDTSEVLGSMLRIHVTGTTYTIPTDNPFASGGGAPEIWAWGLRNPWRWTFDRQTGVLWAGDVGQNEWEEISILENGGNYGWNVLEGTHCFNPPGCDDPTLIPPVYEYPHSGGSASVIGGYVYRGSAIPSLFGVYTFAEFYTGEVFGLFPDGSGGYTADLLAARGSIQGSTFAEDQAGELYVADYAGRIWKIVPSGVTPPTPFPQRLSQTGCFDATDPTLPGPGLIPYEPRSQLWSDGLDKTRWIALPDSETISLTATGDFTFPIGTVLAKHFSWQGSPVETRLMMRHTDGGWGAYTYVWSGGDAWLVTAGQEIDLGAGKSWHVPTQGQCFACHTSAAGTTLGLETFQLNSDLDYGGVIANQLDTLDYIGLFTTHLPAVGTIPALPTLGGGDTAEAQARSYLHANCSFCHRPGGGGLGDIDLRYGTAFADTNLCDVTPTAGTLGIAGAKNVFPGDASKSVLWARMMATGSVRMPPLGTTEVHTEATAAVEAWINGLTGCP